jgi:hypothetical protein
VWGARVDGRTGRRARSLSHADAPVGLELRLALWSVKQAVLAFEVAEHHVAPRRLQPTGCEVNEAHPVGANSSTGRRE